MAGFFLVQYSQVSADHGAETLAVNECQAYQHVLETDDQLYLCRYNVEELEHIPPAIPLGSPVAIMRIEDVISTVIHGNISIPRLGFALQAFYFAENDPDRPAAFSDPDIRISVLENPSLFPVPDVSNLETPEFNVTADLEATADELVNDLPKILLRLETSDATLGVGSIVVGTGITSAGAVFVNEAYPNLLIIAAGAFLPDTIAGGISFSNKSAPDFITNIETTGRNSGFATSLETLGAVVGLPYTGTVMLLMMVMLGIVGFLIVRFTGKDALITLTFWIWPISVIASYLGGWPFAVTTILAGFSLLLGGSMFIRRVLSS